MAGITIADCSIPIGQDGSITYRDLEPDEQAGMDDLAVVRAAYDVETLRSLRDSLLRESDWTELPSAIERLAPDVLDEWATYRQELRDLPANVDASSVVDMPSRPSTR